MIEVIKKTTQSSNFLKLLLKEVTSKLQNIKATQQIFKIRMERKLWTIMNFTAETFKESKRNEILTNINS